MDGVGKRVNGQLWHWILAGYQIKRQVKQLFFIIILLLSAQAAVAQLMGEQSGVSSVDSFIESEGVVEFLPVHEAYQLEVDVREDHLLLNWFMVDGYFLYGHKFTVDLVKNREILSLTVEKEQGEISYDEYFEEDVEKFYHATTLKAILPQELLTQTDNHSLTLTAGYQGCADAGLCYPPEALYYRINLNASTATVFSAPTATPAVSQPDVLRVETSFVLMLLFAVLGGLILNLMPCVFPVLSIKVLSFASSASSQRHLKLHGWMYTLGVVASFILFAALLLAMRSAGQAVGWGFQLQSPMFIAFLAYLFVCLGLVLSGLVEVGGSMMGIGQQLTEGSGKRSSFFTGVLAVVVSSPCSVPFMGTALGFALTQNALPALLVFAALGVGLALPFLVLSHIPALVNLLPKPGLWMERFKELLAFPLYLTAVWLLWVLGHQSGNDAVALLLVGFVLLLFGLWLHRGGARRLWLLPIVVALLLPLSPIIATPDAKEVDTASSDEYWQTYSAEKLAAYISAGEPVFVELTADWCITCLMNEKVALNRPDVIAAMRGQGIHYLRGDWTNGDPEITALLEQYNRAGVPLYLLFSANSQQPVRILPQLLTEGLVLEELKVISRKEY